MPLSPHILDVTAPELHHDNDAMDMPRAFAPIPDALDAPAPAHDAKSDAQLLRPYGEGHDAMPVTASSSNGSFGVYDAYRQISYSAPDSPLGDAFGAFQIQWNGNVDSSDQARLIDNEPKSNTKAAPKSSRSCRPACPSCRT